MRPTRVLAVADSDSYVKWAAGLLDRLPYGWGRRLAVVRSPIAPSPAQLAAALHGTGTAEAPLIPARSLRRLLDTYRPDAVALACTGPAVDVLTGVVLRWGRPVLVSGLPGISVPATERAWQFRAAADLFIVHSHREVAEFAALGEALGMPGRMGLARLPFLTPAAPGPEPNRVIFAPQAKVPVDRSDRERILLSLAGLAAARPDLNVVVKLRAAAGERQTHRERHGYPALWADLAVAGQVAGDALRFDRGPMREHLAHAAGLVTVSSTATLEAIAADVPLLVLSDFGVSTEMINLVFEGSGCLGTLDDLEKAAFRAPDPAWTAANYFHPTPDDDWLHHLAHLLDRARTAGLPPPPRTCTPNRTRARLRLEAPPRMLRTLSRLTDR